MIRRHSLAWLALSVVVGCGGPPQPTLHPVAGLVTLDGQPLDGARVQFFPQDGTGGHGGRAVTDAAGRYEITAAKTGDRKGLPAGTYKVIVSRMRRPDGSLPPPNVSDMETDAQETVPAPYFHRQDSPLIVTVEASAKAFDFPLRKK